MGGHIYHDSWHFGEKPKPPYHNKLINAVILVGFMILLTIGLWISLDGGRGSCDTTQYRVCSQSIGDQS